MLRSHDLVQDVRKYVFDHFLEYSVPPVAEQIMKRFHLGRPQALEVLQALETGRHVRLVPGTQRILMAWPFSAVATPFLVTRRNRRWYFANCAWDAVAFHAMLNEEIRITSQCHDCAETIALTLSNGRTIATPREPVVYLSLPASRWWEDIVNTCSNHMVFFRSRSHLDDWKRENSIDDGATLTIDQTHALSVPLYRDRTKLDYVRPSKEELTAHFQALGLTGPFWEL
ncbi:MAG: hypothetical protein E6J94_08275 [Methanobacteriota archaeon]|nr:MAG: hypothetical protein E6J94_08275 [Euryarchaeota archaeon]